MPVIPILIANRCIVAPPGVLVIDFGNGRIWRDSRLAGPQFFKSHGRLSGPFLFLAALLCCDGTIEKDELIGYLWGHDENGGPNNPETHMASLVTRYRHVIRNFGISVRSDHRRRFIVTALDKS